VCLLGPDGAGKSTVGKRLVETHPFPLVYMNMGINPEASNVMLPTTRLYLSWKRHRGIITPQGGPP
jgi:ABC-type phosphate/phosphonate transport system ATPase subunit